MNRMLDTGERARCVVVRPDQHGNMARRLRRRVCVGCDGRGHKRLKMLLALDKSWQMWYAVASNVMHCVFNACGY